MCTYGALSKFRTKANGSGVLLGWIFSVLGYTGTRVAFGNAGRFRHVGVFWKERNGPLAPF